MPKISDEYLRQLWLQQPVDRESITFEAIEKKVAMLQRAARSQKVVAGLAVAVAAIMFVLNLTGFYAWGGSAFRGSVLSGTIFISCAWSFWSVLRRVPVEPENVDRDVVSFIDYAIEANQRAHDVGISFARRRFLEPSVLASLAAAYIAWIIAPDDKLMAGFIIACLVLAQYVAHKGRMVLRNQVSYLNALRDSIQNSK